MSAFEKIYFHGTFRNYQQRVLDHVDEYLADGKIHIVAAPGSGKTILGLELIRRIGQPCIILSPTKAIREQWGARFRDFFLDQPSEYGSLFSMDLRRISLMTSITYQALYTAMEKVAGEDEEENCQDVDLFQVIRQYGIKTICLDEAHHLKNEWQRALEKFIERLDPDIRIVSLTATPPYDAEGNEWNRYVKICGEIDEEIFVPELVAQSTLCPHQDYVYFNYPAESELAILNRHRENACCALEEIRQLSFLPGICQNLQKEKDYEKLYSRVKEYIALFVLFQYFGYLVSEGMIRSLTVGAKLPRFRMTYAETALQHLLEAEDTTEEEKEALRQILMKHSVYHKRKVTLELNESLRRMLISSVGKLKSIADVVDSEHRNLGADLRMLILTDYIKKENLRKIGTEEEFTSVHVVSIFETLRRMNPGLPIGVLSGALVILPENIDFSVCKQKRQTLPGTGYCVVDFGSSTTAAVDFVGNLFAQGQITILIGTKSLLGEGWDSPCINSLILASFVGSFVMSNQMRGRAIRIDRNRPEKTSNIWHLITVEPEYMIKERTLEQIREYVQRDEETLTSCDFDVLKRRFEAFIGPNYTTGELESGIDRLTAIAPPYTEAGIQAINQKMLQLSADRPRMREMWKSAAGGSPVAVVIENSIPQASRVPVFFFRNIVLLLIFSLIQGGLFYGLGVGSGLIGSFLGAIIFLLLEGIVLGAFYRKFERILKHGTPIKSIQTLGEAVYRALCECGMLSPGARVEAQLDPNTWAVGIYLKNAAMKDQNIFHTAIREMLSPIENPRYLLIRKNLWGGYHYTISYACPSVLGKKKEYAQSLARHLGKTTGAFDAVYTHQEYGREWILLCRKRSYITANEALGNPKFKVIPWE